MLNEKQLLTIEHLNYGREVSLSPKEIIDYCKEKLSRPHRKQGLSRGKTRRHSKEHYLGIIQYYQDQKQATH